MRIRSAIFQVTGARCWKFQFLGSSGETALQKYFSWGLTCKQLCTSVAEEVALGQHNTDCLWTLIYWELMYFCLAWSGKVWDMPHGQLPSSSSCLHPRTIFLYKVFLALPLEVYNLLQSKQVAFGATVSMFIHITSVYNWTCKVHSICFPMCCLWASLTKTNPWQMFHSPLIIS